MKVSIKLMLLVAGLIVMFAVGCILICPEAAVVPVEESEYTDEMEFTVFLNEYEPAKWNRGYGHYDLSVVETHGEKFICNFDNDRVECEGITLSYGPLDGDDSQGRVHLYTRMREDHVPDEKLAVYAGLDYADFNCFMRWFMEHFASYACDGGDYHVFYVRDKEFQQYSITDGNNCASAAMRMIDALPGVLDPQRNTRAPIAEKLKAYFASDF